MKHIDNLAMSLSLLSDDDLAKLALALWMRYPLTANDLRDCIDELENMLTSPRDEGGR